MVSSRGWKQVISFVFSPTSSWARTLLVVWSRAASRWIFRPFARAAPRRLLPSTATARSPLAGRSCGRRSASHRPTARSSASPSIRARTRRMVASPGAGWRPVSGSRRAPSAPRTSGGASATHSLIASSEVAPADTAVAASASTYAKAWRTPRGSRGSGTSASRSSRPGRSPGPVGGWSRSWSRAGGIRDDAAAGTVFQRDRGA